MFCTAFEALGAPVQGVGSQVDAVRIAGGPALVGVLARADDAAHLRRQSSVRLSCLAYSPRVGQGRVLYPILLAPTVVCQVSEVKDAWLIACGPALECGRTLTVLKPAMQGRHKLSASNCCYFRNTAVSFESRCPAAWKWALPSCSVSRGRCTAACGAQSE